MRHRKSNSKLGRTSSHRRCLFANMLKSLIVNGRITTTVAKAKELRRFADQMVTLAKNDSLANRRKAIAEMMIQFNSLTAKEARMAREGDKSAYNDDRKVIDILFGPLKERFITRNGGYTRIVKVGTRVGDAAPTCFIEYLPE